MIGHRKGRVASRSWPWGRALKGPLQRENKRKEGRKALNGDGGGESNEREARDDGTDGREKLFWCLLS